MPDRSVTYKTCDRGLVLRDGEEGRPLEARIERLGAEIVAVSLGAKVEGQTHYCLRLTRGGVEWLYEVVRREEEPVAPAAGATARKAR